MAEVLLKNVWKIFENSGTEVVRDVSIEIPDKEFFVLVGPSGCGKSTTLRMIAGLEEISRGEIWIDGRKVNDVPPKNRDIAMVFQNYALYPHMTVYDNMAFGLKLRKFSKADIDLRVREAAEILNMDHLLLRKPKELSGGQRQRVAVGRAIVRKPKVFLFDEPLSNLDAKLRVQMRTEISKLHKRLKTTMIYVTHDQVEAMTMGTRICVMKDGVIQQIAPPLELYNDPHTEFVAGFIGSPPMNFLTCFVAENKKAKGLLLCESLTEGDRGFELPLPETMWEKARSYLNKKVTFGVRPEDLFDRLFYTGDKKPEAHYIKATIDVTEPMGSEKILYLQTGKNSLVARVEPNNSAEPGQTIEVVILMNRAHLFDFDTKNLIV